MRLRENGAGSGPRRDRRAARLIATLVATALLLGLGSTVVSATASPLGSSAKKCKHGKKHRHCHRPKPAKGRISFTNCPTADLVPDMPYTFTGRVSPGHGGVAIVIQYFDQGSTPLAVHTVVTAADGSFSDSFAYPATGVPRGGSVRASSTTAIDPVCEVSIAETPPPPTSG